MVEESSELNNIDVENDFDNQTPNTMNDETADETDNPNVKPTSGEISGDPNEIRGQIEETRREMGETLDAIQEKLSISNITEQVKDQFTEQITSAVETLKTTVSDATIGKAGKFMKNFTRELKKSNITKMASENSLPIVLIGLGIGLLAFGNFRKKSNSDYAKYRYKKNQFKDEQYESSQPSSSKISEKAGQIYKSVGDSANAAYQSVSDSANAAYHSLNDAAGNTYEKIGDLGGKIRSQYDHHLDENPLVIGAIALAAGAAIGLIVPTTSYEGELMGAARENLMAKAEDAARGAFEKVQEVVGQAKDVTADEVKNQTSEQQNS